MVGPGSPSFFSNQRLPCVCRDVATKENDMTGQAALRLRRTLCFIASSLTFAAVLMACISMTSATEQQSAPDYAAIIAAPDRSEENLQTDKRSGPAQWLEFTASRTGN